MTAPCISSSVRPMPGWGWQHLSSDAGIDVSVDGVVRGPGCTISHVDVNEQPHLVSFEGNRPTLLIYDATAYLNGERGVDDLRSRRSGPMGDTVDIIPARSRFDGRADRGSKMGCTLITIDPDATDGFDESWKDMASSLRPALGLKNRVVSALGERLRTFARSGTSGWSAGYLHGAASLMLNELCNELKVGPQRRRSEARVGGLSAWAQRKILDYLRDNLDQKIDLGALADEVRLSRFHFSRTFKKTFGESPSHYLMRLRVDRATELLRDSRRSITDVALELGFPTSAEFARAFRHTMNCTPREFRQRCSN